MRRGELKRRPTKLKLSFLSLNRGCRNFHVSNERVSRTERWRVRVTKLGWWTEHGHINARFVNGVNILRDNGSAAAGRTALRSVITITFTKPSLTRCRRRFTHQTVSITTRR
jgi:hypothetical protein